MTTVTTWQTKGSPKDKKHDHATEAAALKIGVPLCMVCHAPAVRGLVKAWGCDRCGLVWG